MEVPVNYLAVLVAAIVPMVLGFLWYGPLFGKQWMAWSGVVPDAGAKAKVNIGYAVAFVGALLMSYVLSHLIVFASAYMQTSGTVAGLSTGFWVWLGFVAPVLLGHTLWEGKPWKLYFLNNSYQLLSLLIMSAILAAWM